VKKVMKNVLHCNENLIILLLEKELRGLRPLPLLRLTLIDALGQCNGDRSEFASEELEHVNQGE
jgi:hypothetical protein